MIVSKIATRLNLLWQFIFRHFLFKLKPFLLVFNAEKQKRLNYDVQNVFGSDKIPIMVEQTKILWFWVEKFNVHAPIFFRYHTQWEILVIFNQKLSVPFNTIRLKRFYWQKLSQICLPIRKMLHKSSVIDTNSPRMDSIFSKGLPGDQLLLKKRNINLSRLSEYFYQHLLGNHLLSYLDHTHTSTLNIWI